MNIALAPIALNPYITNPSDSTYRNDIQTILTRVRKIGYEAIEKGTPEGFSNEEYRAAVDRAGIKVLTAGKLDYPALLKDDFSSKIKECKILNAPNVMVSNMDNLVLGNDDELKKFIRCLNRAGKALREEGLRLSYHNHAVDFTRINGRTIFDRILEGTDPRYVFIEPDTHWIQAGGGHVITWLKKLKGRIFIVHFKDYAIDQYSDHTFLECTHRCFAEVGEGNLNWPGIIKECLEQNIEWCAAEQDRTQRPPYESIAISYKNLKAFGV
jgi:sugar phosphate isomerase/epimerase